MDNKLELGIKASAILLLNVWAFSTVWGMYTRYNPELFTEKECSEIVDKILEDKKKVREAFND